MGRFQGWPSRLTHHKNPHFCVKVLGSLKQTHSISASGGTAQVVAPFSFSKKVGTFSSENILLVH